MLQYVDSVKTKVLTTKDKNLIKGNEIEIEEEANYCLQEITENMNNLAIHSDSDFKIIHKNNNKGISNERYENLHKTNRNIIPLQTVSSIDDIESIDTSKYLRVECTHINELTRLKLNEDTENCIEEHEQNETQLRISTTENNYLVNDLNSLLIMMALTPNSNNDGDHCSHRTDYDQEKAKGDEVETEFFHVPCSSRSKINEDVSNFLCVAPMRIKISEQEETILKKYVEKWRSYVSFKREQLTQQRKVALDNFFDKLAKKKTEINDGPQSVKKAKLLVHDFNTYQRR